MMFFIGPLFGIIPEQFRLGHAETIDALLHVADHEQVGIFIVMAQRLDDGVLGGVDVLAFVHENMLEPLAPLLGDLVAGQYLQRQLLQIRKVNPARSPLGGRKLRAECPRQLQQCPHRFAGQVPLFNQWVGAFIRKPAGQFRRLFKKFLQQPAAGAGAGNPKILSAQLEGMF